MPLNPTHFTLHLQKVDGAQADRQGSQAVQNLFFYEVAGEIKWAMKEYSFYFSLWISLTEYAKKLLGFNGITTLIIQVDKTCHIKKVFFIF